jgi:23S rRNA (uracil1939-C5)-methyltransferase
MTRKRNFPIIHDVEITEIAAEGNALARVNNQVIFIPKGIPGDVVDVQVIRKKSNYMMAKIIDIKKLSPVRIEPKCKHFGICGGCKWQHLPYLEQIKWKQKQVTDTIERIGGIEPEKINSILPSEDIYYYRNKLEYTFSNNRWLPKELIESDNFVKLPGAGFHIEGMFDKVLDIDYCYLQKEPSNELRNELKRYLLDNNIPFFDLRTKEGLVRNLIVRNTMNGQFMAVVVFGNSDKAKINNVLSFIDRKFPDLHSIMYGINNKLNDSLTDIGFKCWKGESYLFENIENLTYRIGPKSFFQTNSRQACNLYSIVRRMADISSGDIVYDLYTGTGTIALFLAPYAKRVIGIEYVEEAILDACENAALNNITNAEFFSGDVKDILTTEFIKIKGNPDVLITDPPRAGMHENVIETILSVLPSRIVYVSCNPATQARDLKMLSEQYRIAEIQPVDMFPHTHHVENIACLIKR